MRSTCLALALVATAGCTASLESDEDDIASPAAPGGAPAGAGSAPPRTGGPPPGTGGPPVDAAAPSGVPPGDAGRSADAAPAARCAPGGGGPHWTEEAQPLRVRIACATGLPLAGADFEITGLPAGAVYDPATAAVSWTPRLDQAGTHTLTVSARALGESGAVRIAVADRFDDPANVPLKDPAAYPEEHGLPVFHLFTAPDVNKQAYTRARLVYRGQVQEIEARYRGTSSAAYPKKNFTLRFPKQALFDDPALGEGFRKKRKLALVTTFDDNSYVRVRLAFELWNRMDPAHLKVQHASAVLFLNGKYHGLYAVTDKIDGALLQEHGLPDETNLFMGSSHDANLALHRYNEGTPSEETRPKASLAEGYEKKDGQPPEGQPGAFDEIVGLVDFVARADAARFAAEAPRRLQLRDHFDWFVHCLTLQAWDTLAKNTFHFRDPADGGRWRVVVWDFNESFGQDWRTGRYPWMSDPKEMLTRLNKNRLWIRLWNDPTLGPQLRARYGQMLRGPMSRDVALGAFDALVREIGPGARRDERRWQAAYRSYFRFRNDFTSFEQEVAYVRRWIQERWTYLLARF